MRGDGNVYKRGPRWWMVYHRDGERFREPCGKDVTSKTDAKAVLNRIHREIREGTYLAPVQRQVTVDELLDDLIVHLENDGAASVRKVESHLRAVRSFCLVHGTNCADDEAAHLRLGKRRAVDLDTATVERYQRARLDLGRARATVNRECEALREALRLAASVKPPKITAPLNVPMLKVRNARQGFVNRADFSALLGQLEDADVRDFVEWFYWTGMRPNEIRQLTWTMLDRETWTLNLDPKADKTRDGRALAITGPLRSIIDQRLAARRLDCPLIFHRVSHRRPGQPVRDFRKLWQNALAAAKLPAGLLPYDLRRTAVRNLIRAGVPQAVAMDISGHKTVSTFKRYNITDTEDIRAAITRTAEYVATLPTERNVVALPASDTPQKRHTAAPRRQAR